MKEVITRGKNKGQEKDVVVEEFSKYCFLGIGGVCTLYCSKDLVEVFFFSQSLQKKTR